MTHLDQYKFSDILQKTARNGADYWYGEKWKTVNKCVFCDLKDRYVIKTLDDIVLTTNIYPYTNGHLMIIPKKHITHIKQLTPKQWESIRILTYVSKKMLRAAIGIKSVWVVYREGKLGSTSEKTVEHLHIHIIPYTEGLVQWNYQEITYSPFEIASVFRKADNQMEKFIKRYKKKYLK